ncbi:secretory lipase-domain-containing protein [Aspergillus multicolor]|uniref:secretory lipase-domain-containing protein n=1 Tax=Aspergillus multicolor TaxID=41759 RepID=UPI003CCD48E9
MAVLPPSIDPWYTAPPHYESATPGEILRIRPGPESILTAISFNASSIYNILYRTTDVFSDPLSYQIPYNTVNVNHSPSYALATEYSMYFADITTVLERGWFVNIPDFEGPSASFSVSLESAHVTLDSIRSVIAADTELGLDIDTRNVLWGYSGGTLPSELAAEIAASYAPELDIAGIAIGGVIVDTEHVLRVTDNTSYAALGPLMTLGLATRVDGPFNVSTFYSATGMTVLEAYRVFENQSISRYFSGGSDWLDESELRAPKEVNWHMGRLGTPKVPMFVYTAINDKVCAVEDVDSLVEGYCADGASVRYERNTAGNYLCENWIVS